MPAEHALGAGASIVPSRGARPARMSTSAAARLPDWTAELNEPYWVVAVSTPAQWMRPNGARMAGPKPTPV